MRVNEYFTRSEAEATMVITVAGLEFASNLGSIAEACELSVCGVETGELIAQLSTKIIRTSVLRGIN